MNRSGKLISALTEIRHQYGSEMAKRKKNILKQLASQPVSSTGAAKEYYDTLLFLMAYPDDAAVYAGAAAALRQLEDVVKDSARWQERLYNSGVTGSMICAEFGFEIVKWLRHRYGHEVYIDSIGTDDGQVLSILSVVMPQVESEILQDENSTWQEWLKEQTEPDDDLLGTLLRLFDHSSIRPEVKDELWTALHINITVSRLRHLQLPPRLVQTGYHTSLIKTATLGKRENEKPVRLKISAEEAEKIIECGRMILVRNLREIDPVSFSDASMVSYYLLPRGFSIALFGMRHERRHPIDSYMGYVVFKNGLPVAYAGSWVLFDSARIGLNVFPSYRGGESLYIFEQVLKVHKQVYRLNRFTADPYQIGKHNPDGIKSGAFWVYYKLGFRPMRDELKQIAEEEWEKLSTKKGYRTSAVVLRKLADSRMELVVGKSSYAKFDATDLSLVYIDIVTQHYGGNRKKAEQETMKKLLKALQWSPGKQDENLMYVLRNWCVLLYETDKWKNNKSYIASLKDLFRLKAAGDEEAYIHALQKYKV